MPYKSDAQRRFMHAKHPEIAKRWDDKYGKTGDLPERKHKKALKGLKDAKP
jgi:hypothetical protein